MHNRKWTLWKELKFIPLLLAFFDSGSSLTMRSKELKFIRKQQLFDFRIIFSYVTRTDYTLQNKILENLWVK